MNCSFLHLEMDFYHFFQDVKELEIGIESYFNLIQQLLFVNNYTIPKRYRLPEP